MEKEKTEKAGLELIISEYLNNIITTNKPTKEQLRIISFNWEESKKHILKLTNNYGLYFHSELLKRLKKEFNIGFSDEEARDLYNSLIEYDLKTLTDLPNFAQNIKIPLTKKQEKKFWLNFLNKPNWKKYHLEDVVENLGTPKLTKGELSYICNDYLKIIAGEKEIDRVKVPETTQAEDLLYLLNLIKSSPEWDMELAEKALNKQIYFLANEFCNDRFELFFNKIGLILNPKIIRGYYRNLLSGKESVYYSAERIVKDFEIALKRTGVSLEKEDKEDEKAVLDFYREFLRPGNLNHINKMQQLTNIPYNQVVDLVYSNFLKQGNIGLINQLRRKLNIEPSFDEYIVQEAYNNLFQNGEIEKALRVYLETDVEPKTNEKIIKQAYNKIEKILTSKELPYHLSMKVELQSLEWMNKRFPEQSANFVKKQIKRLVKENKFDEINFFLEINDTSQNLEEDYVLSYRRGDWEKAKSLFEKNKEVIFKEYPEYAKLYKYIP